MSKILRTMVVAGTLSLGTGSLFGAAAQQSTPAKGATTAPATAQSSAPVTDQKSGKKKATSHHAKHHQHSHSKNTTQPAGSAAATPKQ